MFQHWRISFPAFCSISVLIKWLKHTEAFTTDKSNDRPLIKRTCNCAINRCLEFWLINQLINPFRVGLFKMEPHIYLSLYGRNWEMDSLFLQTVLSKSRENIKAPHYSMLLLLCEGNPPETGDSSHKRPVKQRRFPCQAVIICIRGFRSPSNDVDLSKLFHITCLLITWHGKGLEHQKACYWHGQVSAHCHMVITLPR